MFAKCFARIILQYVPEGSGSWKYNHYFPVAKGEGKTSQRMNHSVNELITKLFVGQPRLHRIFQILYPVRINTLSS